MNKAAIKSTIDKSLSGAAKFPDVVGALLAEGVESYHVDLVRSENRYYAADGESHVENVPFEHPRAAAEFSAEKVQAAVKKAQAGQIDYPQFLREILAAGTVHYVAYLAGKRVVYCGRNGDSHTEFFPGAR